ncbi:MAG: hypothetical protein IIB65_02940 [Proteobacteria bacterium]|nr:hypothetical protein [Pseudomonadota bacterium]
MERWVPIVSLVVMAWLTMTGVAGAHHVLGRPAYSLNEDSNTPPAMQAEVRTGDYFVTYMAFPAFPRPGHPGRISLYVRRIDDGTPFQGKVAFKVRGSSWLSWLGIGNESHGLGLQPPDDNVFRQGFLFEKAGDYIITAQFEADGEPYVIDFPLRIGEPPPIGPIGIAVGALAIVLLTVNIVQRRRSMTGKIRGAREGK